MTREEFIKRSNALLNCVDRMYVGHSCCLIRVHIGFRAREVYNREFKFGDRACWVDNYLKSIDYNTAKSRTMLRQFLIALFVQWSLDQELYLEY